MTIIFNKYTMWLGRKVATNETSHYIFLLEELNKVEYYFIHPLDQARVIDALELRKQFATEDGSNAIYDVMPGSCTALELLVAMAERADYTLYNTADGSRTGQFFWLFVENLGLLYLSDDNWSFEAANFIRVTVNKWFDRRFNPNGYGSPWPIPTTRVDLTTVSFWDAMQWYLSENEEVL